MPGIKAFVAAVFGGIGSVPGAMIGGILLGIIEIFAKAYISSQMADANCVCSADRGAAGEADRTCSERRFRRKCKGGRNGEKN